MNMLIFLMKNLDLEAVAQKINTFNKLQKCKKLHTVFWEITKTCFLLLLKWLELRIFMLFWRILCKVEKYANGKGISALKMRKFQIKWNVFNFKDLFFLLFCDLFADKLNQIYFQGNSRFVFLVFLLVSWLWKDKLDG